MSLEPGVQEKEKLVREFFEGRGFAVAEISAGRSVAVESGADGRVFIVLGPHSDGRLSVQLVYPDSTPKLEMVYVDGDELHVLMDRLASNSASRTTAPDSGQIIMTEASLLGSVGWDLVGRYCFVYSDCILLRRERDGIVVRIDWLEVRCDVIFTEWANAVARMGAAVPTREIRVRMPSLSEATTARSVKREFGRFFRELAVELAE